MHENQLSHLSPAAPRDGASCVSAPSPARVRTRAIRIAQSLHASAKAKLACRKGQGTTEYAILVGVLVVIAILAITVFKPKIQEEINHLVTVYHYSFWCRSKCFLHILTGTRPLKI